MGTRAKGSMYTLKLKYVCSIISDTNMGNMVINT